MSSFEASRPNGRSDRVVVYELTKQADPDTLFTYDDL